MKKRLGLGLGMFLITILSNSFSSISVSSTSIKDLFCLFFSITSIRPFRIIPFDFKILR